jgi:hypothetical protein
MKMKNKHLHTLLFILISVFSIQGSPAQSQEIFKKFNGTVLGENVFLFDEGMNMKDIQVLLDTVFNRQTGRKGEFTNNRYAMLFKSGRYNLDIRIDYYMQVLGLGNSPEDVVIKGAVRSNTTMWNSVLCNFWRSVENLTVEPVRDTMVWGVSQASPMRRVHVKGNLKLFDIGYASGGFLADSKVDGTISSGPQQQWFTRNSDIRKWIGSNWNMMFVGVNGAPLQNWPEGAYTTINTIPLIREKPYLTFDEKGFNVKVPALKTNSSGNDWMDQRNRAKTYYLDKFYVAKAGSDNSETINEALKKGKNILFSPGRYLLQKSLVVNKPGTIIMGIGLATLIPTNGNAAVEIADIDDVTVCGLTIDAGSRFSDFLFQVGEPGSKNSHSKKPTFLYDIFFRVGGPAEGSARACLVINSNDVYIDHTWLWRADHGNGVGWDKNRCANGLVVNGNNVTIYGLFNEHFQEYQTLWNGNNGRVYFYQSEMPYDPPSVEAWKHNGVNGYASYKVSDKVISHEAWGLGIYNVFYNAPVIVDNAIETPASLENKIHNKIIFWLNGNKESEVKSIINGKGGPINVKTRKAVMK